jgi:hypothetical protein
MPSIPTSLLPQHIMPPPVTSAQEKAMPVAMAVATTPGRGHRETRAEKPETRIIELSRAIRKLISPPQGPKAIGVEESGAVHAM